MQTAWQRMARETAASKQGMQQQVEHDLEKLQDPWLLRQRMQVITNTHGQRFTRLHQAREALKHAKAAAC